MSGNVRRAFSWAILLTIISSLRTTQADVCVYKPPKVQRVCGVIVDADGRPIPNVNVSVLKEGNALKISTTDDTGEFDFDSIQSGKYELDAAVAGFQRARYQLTVSKPADSCKHALKVKMASGAIHCDGDIRLTNQQPKPQSLCKFDLSMGNHRSVRVAAVAEAGTDMGVLSDPGCPSRQPVWFELALKSRRNRAELSAQLKRSGKAAVVVSGQLYGPPEPDPKLPGAMRDSIRKNFHGGWGHLGAFPMKLVVFRIESVAPTGKPYTER